jgi:hypothetical protein
MVSDQKTERSIKELLELMLSHQSLFRDGLCVYIYAMYVKDLITFLEYEILKNYLHKNKPKHTYNVLHWWPVGEIQPRIEWINKQLEKLSNE